MKKLLAILLAAASLFAFAACGEPKYAHGSKKTILKMGDHKVTEEFYRYFLLNTMNDMSEGAEGFFDGADREQKLKELDEMVHYNLAQYYAVLDLAKELEIELNDDGINALHVSMKGLRAEFEDEEEYKKGLEETYLSEYVAYALYYNEALYNELYEVMSQTGKYFSNKREDILKYARENFLFCRQFVVKTDDTENDAEARQTAVAIRSRLLDNEDPATVLADYEKDENVIGGYYCFAESEDFAALNEDAVADMKPGEISELREDGYGFHIIVRLEVDDEYLEDNFAGTVFESYCMHQIYLRLTEIMDGYKIEYKVKKAPEEYR